jgi:hypothetical protein
LVAHLNRRPPFWILAIPSGHSRQQVGGIDPPGQSLMTNERTFHINGRHDVSRLQEDLIMRSTMVSPANGPMRGTLRRRATAGIAAALLAVAASTLFGGAALASGHNHHRHDHNGPTYDAGNKNHFGGRGGGGGQARANCAVPLGVSAGVIGQGGNDSQCNAQGGNAGAGGFGEQ